MICIEEMTPKDKAELITAISKTLEVNKVIGTYESLEKEGVHAIKLLIKSIK